jgi:hypothetical protein
MYVAARSTNQVEEMRPPFCWAPFCQEMLICMAKRVLFAAGQQPVSPA